MSTYRKTDGKNETAVFVKETKQFSSLNHSHLSSVRHSTSGPKALLGHKQAREKQRSKEGSIVRLAGRFSKSLAVFLFVASNKNRAPVII